MGIAGLLPVLKSITRPVHVSEYRGRRVAVDAYCWLHRGAYTCSVELCEGTPTDKCAPALALFQALPQQEAHVSPALAVTQAVDESNVRA